MERPKQPWKYVFIVVAIALLAFMVVDFNERVSGLQHLLLERDKVDAEKAALLQTQVALKDAIGNASSDTAAAEWAYVEGHMVRPGEIPIVPLQSGEVTPTPIEVEQVVPTQSSKWDNWRALFFGQNTP